VSEKSRMESSVFLHPVSIRTPWAFDMLSFVLADEFHPPKSKT